MSSSTISTNDDGVAIGGYDPVSYFTESQAKLGSAAHSTDWNGATWHFTSAENTRAFAADPEKYAPAFGGRCAFGASMGRDAEASPEAWRMIDGKLCLMMSGSVKMLSNVFTGKIRKAMKTA